MNQNDIPHYWSAEEALTFCAFLEDLISAIWKSHGPQMAKHLQKVRHLRDRFPPDCSDPDISNDLPF